MKLPAPRRSTSFSRSLLVAAVVALAPACGQSGAPGSGAATSQAEAPKAPSPEIAMFAPSKAVLAELPAMKLVPKGVTAVLAARDPAGIVEKLGALASFGEAKEGLAKEIDAELKGLTKDLPEIAGLAQSGVDLGKPVGVVLFDPEFETAAIFAAVSDEAAMKRWMEERAKLSNGKRAVKASGEATVLMAKSDVSRAVVLRKGHVFWVRAKDGYRGDSGVAAAAEALATGTEADSLGADPAFSKAIGALAFGSQAAMFASGARFSEGLLAGRRAEVDDAQKEVDEAQAALKKAEEKKRKRAADDAKIDLDGAERKKKLAEERLKEIEVLALAKDAIPAMAAGMEMGEREVKLKGFVATGTGAALKVLAPLAQAPIALDPALGARKAAHLSVDARLLEFAMKHFQRRRWSGSALPLDRARSALLTLGVTGDKLSPLLDGEVSAAAHAQKVAVAPAAAEDAGAPDASAAPGPTEQEREGFTVAWGVTDGAAAKALLDEGWKGVESSERAAKGGLKKLGEGSFEIAAAYPGDLTTRVRLVGTSLLVTTLPAVAEAAGDGKARATWMAASENPALKQLAGIEGATGIVAVDRVGWVDSSPLGKLAAMQEIADFGILGLLGGSSKKGEKLRKQRDKLRDQRRELESALDAKKEAAWKDVGTRAGPLVLFAKPAEGGVAIFGGLFPREASVTALAEAALGAWMSVGPRWEKWGELQDLKKKIREIDDQIEEESKKSMEDLLGGRGGIIGGVLGGIGTGGFGGVEPLGPSNKPFVSGPGGLGSRAWDDDLGSGTGLGLSGAGRAGTAAGSGKNGSGQKK